MSSNKVDKLLVEVKLQVFDLHQLSRNQSATTIGRHQGLKKRSRRFHKRLNHNTIQNGVGAYTSILQVLLWIDLDHFGQKVVPNWSQG